VTATAGSTRAETGVEWQTLFDQIGAGAVERERTRQLPYAAVNLLQETGFGALRIPVENGGAGLTFVDFIDLLLELARADSNLPQLLRGHLGFTELVLAGRAPGSRQFWLREIAAGALIGNAQSERGPAALFAPQTQISRTERGWVVDGQKYYSTGSIFADWIYLSALSDGQFATAVVRSDQPGVVRRDDWDGFGQRLTGSGTTVFTGAAVDPAHIEVSADRSLPVSTQQAVFQLCHVVTLAGIAQRVQDDAVQFVRGRSRNGFLAQVAVPRQDPQVQQVIGEIAGLSLAATATARSAAAALGRVLDAEERGTATADDYAAADAVVFSAQGVVIDLTLRAASELFRVGGASATSQNLALDRHWRNARTVGSHNPEVFRARAVGGYLLNGDPPAAIAPPPPPPVDANP
jgi:alkylation response protein AidB-like acyl-CoA dehydrogenase